jgi:adenosylmethionine-8-amino-7-oxononanoate aminotransferase
MATLEAEFGQHPNVGDIRGRGLFQGVEFVVDRATKAPFDASRKIAGRIKTVAFNAGLICYPMSGTIDGKNGDHVLLAPPFIISDDQIDELVSKLSGAIETVLRN